VTDRICETFSKIDTYYSWKGTKSPKRRKDATVRKSGKHLENIWITSFQDKYSIALGPAIQMIWVRSGLTFRYRLEILVIFLIFQPAFFCEIGEIVINTKYQKSLAKSKFKNNVNQRQQVNQNVRANKII